MSKFIVHVGRTIYQVATVEIEAEDAHAAQAYVEENDHKLLNEEMWSDGEPDNVHVTDVESLDPDDNQETFELAEFLRTLNGLPNDKVGEAIGAKLKSGEIDLTELVRAARVHRTDPTIAPVLDGIKAMLLGGF